MFPLYIPWLKTIALNKHSLKIILQNTRLRTKAVT